MCSFKRCVPGCCEDCKAHQRLHQEQAEWILPNKLPGTAAEWADVLSTGQDVPRLVRSPTEFGQTEAGKDMQKEACVPRREAIHNPDVS